MRLSMHYFKRRLSAFMLSSHRMVIALVRREKPPIMVFVNARKSADVLYRDVQKQVT